MVVRITWLSTVKNRRKFLSRQVTVHAVKSYSRLKLLLSMNIWWPGLRARAGPVPAIGEEKEEVDGKNKLVLPGQGYLIHLVTKYLE